MIILVDGNNLAYRNFAALGNLSTRKGEKTGAVYGFLISLYGIVRDRRPSQTIVFWDGGICEWRRRICQTYKANRSHRGSDVKVDYDDYLRQLTEITRILTILGVSQTRLDGVEADDMLSITLSNLSVTTGLDQLFLIVSSDKDFYQLLSLKVSMLRPPYKVAYTEKDFLDEYGVLPDYWPSVRALMGDPSDNISGVPGVGPVRALKFVREYMNSTGRFEDLDLKILKALKDNYVKAIVSNLEQAKVNREVLCLPKRLISSNYTARVRAKMRTELKRICHIRRREILENDFRAFCQEKELHSIQRERDDWFEAFRQRRL